MDRALCAFARKSQVHSAGLLLQSVGLLHKLDGSRGWSHIQGIGLDIAQRDAQRFQPDTQRRMRVRWVADPSVVEALESVARSPPGWFVDSVEGPSSGSRFHSSEVGDDVLQTRDHSGKSVVVDLVGRVLGRVVVRIAEGRGVRDHDAGVSRLPE